MFLRHLGSDHLLTAFVSHQFWAGTPGAAVADFATVVLPNKIKSANKYSIQQPYCRPPPPLAPPNKKISIDTDLNISIFN